MVLEQQATGICLKEGTMERIPRPTSLSDFKETEVLKKKDLFSFYVFGC